MRMIVRFSRWLLVCLLLQGVSACSYFQYYADRYTPHSGQSAYLHQLQWLREHDVQVVQVGDQLRLILDSDKFFEPASDEILATKDCVLAEIAHVVSRCGKVPLEISGHTDDIGEFQSKQRISELQAQAIAAYLWQHGVRWHRMSVHGFANDVTVAADRTVEGSMHNRRVEIHIS